MGAIMAASMKPEGAGMSMPWGRGLLALGLGLVAAQGMANPCTAVADLQLPPVGEARLTLLGETHGTEQMPRVALALFCQTLSPDRLSVFGIEAIQEDMQEMQRYLASAGRDEDRRQLLALGFWQRGRDGRSSRAVFELIEALRVLRASGARVVIDSFYSASSRRLTADERPSQRANALRAAAHVASRLYAHPGAHHTLLLGSLHAGRSDPETRALVGDPDYRSAGDWLSLWMPTRLVEVTHQGGQAWICLMGKEGAPDCGVKPIAAATAARRSQAFDHAVEVGALTASVPAAGSP